MKSWRKPSKLQLYSFITSMPIIDVLINYIMFGEALFTDVQIWVISFPLIYLLGWGSWRGHVIIGNWIRHKYASLEQTKTRLFLQIFCLIPFMSFSVCFIFILYHYLHILHYRLSAEDLKMGLLVGICVNIIFESLFEADYTLERYKESMVEKQYLQQLVSNQEFDALKSQVNPHFLFNCFNTLSSLIAIDRIKASQFLDELSKVYRYLLRNNTESISTVDSEVKFIESYARLLRTRYGESVKIIINIHPEYVDYYVPSLSLQLLVENAVKHNILTKEQPLIIDIFTTAGNKLIVNNNLQRRQEKSLSNGIGLDNIRAKYLLLGQPGFLVMEDERNYTVVLPLIWNNNADMHFEAKELKSIAQ